MPHSLITCLMLVVAMLSIGKVEAIDKIARWDEYWFLSLNGGEFKVLLSVDFKKNKSTKVIQIWRFRWSTLPGHELEYYDVLDNQNRERLNQLVSRVSGSLSTKTESHSVLLEQPDPITLRLPVDEAGSDSREVTMITPGNYKTDRSEATCLSSVGNIEKLNKIQIEDEGGVKITLYLGVGGNVDGKLVRLRFKEFDLYSTYPSKKQFLDDNDHDDSPGASGTTVCFFHAAPYPTYPVFLQKGSDFKAKSVKQSSSPSYMHVLNLILGFSFMRK
ncbi:hypothetical protein NX722_07250 [Endozoicomonas gorgoniicola]|uniref:Uncharacterized protein n=1 Tax=Endozoicomonas gorgoniicola TaxID=1234144 RepID=A0ABT3MST4_9GAMM|nr:hypothetical protein [Endozoicomonas gorgoniicola]MCW7552442.1 hypothetical protein [Endozoicomonas gorgoniicola]